TFDAANAAFRRGDYQVAGRLLHAIDVKLLDRERQERMKQMMMCPEMQPGGLTPTVAKADGPGTITNDGTGGARTNVNDAGTSRQADYLKQVEDLREVKFQKMRWQELEAEKQARKLADAGDTEQALDVLERYLQTLPSSGLDPDKTALLRRPAE